MAVSASSPALPDLHLLLTAPDPAATPAGVQPAGLAPLGRWFGRGTPLADFAGLPRDHAAELAGLAPPVPWAACWVAGQPGPGAASRAGPEAQWLWLEPVRMAAGMNNVSMAPPEQTLDARGLHTLSTLLAPALQEAGLRVEAGPGRLLALFEPALELRCTPPEMATAAALRDCLPEGRDAGRLRRLLTECQMLLHQAAEAGTPLPGGANAVWAWGEGRRLAPRAAPGVRVFSDDPLLRALDASLSGPAAGAARTDAGAGTAASARLLTTLAQADGSRRLIWVGAASDPGLPALLESAEAALRRRALASIGVSCWPGGGAPARRVRLERGQLWRWWRRAVAPWNPPA